MSFDCHVVWIGDESAEPKHLIATWRKPGVTVRVWRNRDLEETEWLLGRHIQEMLDRGSLCGAADLMRYEILWRHGGLAVDADSECVRELPEWLLEPSCFLAWESEFARPGLISNGTMWARSPRHPFFDEVVSGLAALDRLPEGEPWQVTGPGLVTTVFRGLKGAGVTIWPSQFFYPTHYTGIATGNKPVFARQQWQSTQAAFASAS